MKRFDRPNPFETLECSRMNTVVYPIFIISVVTLIYGVLPYYFLLALLFLMMIVSYKIRFDRATGIKEVISIEDYPNFLQELLKREDLSKNEINSRLYNWPAYTDGIDCRSVNIAEGQYKGCDFLLSELNEKAFSKEAFFTKGSFLCFKIMTKQKIDGDLLIRFKKTFNFSVRFMKRIHFANDYGFYVSSNKKVKSNLKIQDLLKELEGVREKYKNIEFAVFLRENVATITILKAKSFCQEDLKIFFDLFSVIEVAEKDFPFLLRKDSVKSGNKWLLALMSIPIFIVVSIALIGIVLACLEIKNFWLVIVIPILCVIGLVIKKKKEDFDLD